MKRLLPIIAIILFASSAVDGKLAEDAFNYGGEGDGLEGGDGGRGWNGPWGAGGTPYEPGSLFSSQPGYANFMNLDAPFGGRIIDGLSPCTRLFEAPLTGEVWVSLLVDAAAQPSGAVLVNFNTSFNHVRFGLRPAVTPTLGFGEDFVAAASGVSEDLHLLLARIEMDWNGADQERLSLWVDPADLQNGVAGLGSPLLMRDDMDVSAALNNVQVSLGNNSSADALRVSSGVIQSDAKLWEVLHGIPAPQCMDGLDNDGDNEIDLADADCDDEMDRREGPPPCGLGAELVGVLWLVTMLRRWRGART